MPRSHEELTQLALNLVDADRQVQWGVADYALEDKEGNGVSTKAIASDWGLSDSTVNRMIRAAKRFPAKEDRAVDLSFSHFLIAMTADTPKAWIVQAADQHWSTRDLRDAIQQHHAADPVQAEQTAWDRALQRVRKILEASEAQAKAIRLEQLRAIGQ